MPSETQKLRQTANTWIGIAIVVTGIGAFLAHGYYFDLWGQKLQFRWASLGWWGWIAIISFGSGFMTGGVKSGVKAAASISGLLVLALIIGVLTGRYG
ncbi:hypothetical protein [Asticcacaulis sp. W401b]|uniref:hypothetical protein n=1 Tax=Asticcacaulis sp. W401b TaxID=3388666 RepID=UPI0039704BBA